MKHLKIRISSVLLLLTLFLSIYSITEKSITALATSVLASKYQSTDNRLCEIKLNSNLIIEIPVRLYSTNLLDKSSQRVLKENKERYNSEY